MDILSLQTQLKDVSNPEQTPPVDKWNPPFCGDMPLVIKSNGQWWHSGTPFTRAKLVQLFASVLKKENEDYYLVTPVEKIGIQVEDVPFIIVDSEVVDDGIEVITQVGERFLINREHAIELRNFRGQVVPYVHVRRGLWARLHQNVLYRWVEEAEEISESNMLKLIMTSGDYSFSIGEVAGD